jgi:hypothetical protein
MLPLMHAILPFGKYMESLALQYDLELSARNKSVGHGTSDWRYLYKSEYSYNT